MVCLFVVFLLFFLSVYGARCSSVVEDPLMVRWVVGSIPHGVFVCCCFVVFLSDYGARCSSVVRGSAHGEMGRRIDTSWCVSCWFLCFLSVYGARCSSVVRGSAHGEMGRRIDTSWCVCLLLFCLGFFICLWRKM